MSSPGRVPVKTSVPQSGSARRAHGGAGAAALRLMQGRQAAVSGADLPTSVFAGRAGVSSGFRPTLAQDDHGSSGARDGRHPLAPGNPVVSERSRPTAGVPGGEGRCRGAQADPGVGTTLSVERPTGRSRRYGANPAAAFASVHFSSNRSE